MALLLLFLSTSLSYLMPQMILQILFRYHKPPQLFIINSIIISIILANPLLSANPKYEACAPKYCGNGPIIKYPFWVPNEQEKFCGYPHFEIRCYHKYPILRISIHDFLVSDISYSYSSFLVANIAVYKEKCPAPMYNYSLDFDQTPFKYSSDNFNMSFFYNCTTKPIDYPTYKVDCAENASHYSFGLFHKEALQQKNYFNECQFMVEVPVKMNASVNFTTLLRMNYTEILKTGFLVNWSAPDCQHCEKSGGRCGFDDYKFICFCKDKLHHKTCDDESPWNWRRKLIVGAAASSFSVIVMSIAFCFYQRRQKNRYAKSYQQSQSQTISTYSSTEDVEKGSKYFGVHLFTYTELEKATDSFDSTRELGDGGFGTVYRGKLRDGRTVAVKKLYENNCRRVEQFMNEVEILTRLRHQNLVQLYGCTSRYSRELLLVYEYIPNGTVADHLHGERAKQDTLPWHIRKDIAIETASALAYLHASDIIHRDVKTTNILLDSHFCVKVADFGLSRLFPNDVTHISTAPQGTPGYVDPEYNQCYQLTDKSDVYSFGVVLIELISSMPAVDITRHRHEINLSNMAINKIQNGELHELVDPTLGFEADYKVRKMINGVAEVAFQCLQSMKDMRPSMEEVVERLKEIQNDRKDETKAEEINISADDVVLLKNEPPPPSPDSNMRSTATTPNASG